MAGTRRTLVGAIAAVGLMAVASTPAGAAKIVVRPGESIQRAVRQAEPGDKVRVRAGVYRESVQVKEDRIQLRGAGPSRDGTVIRPPSSTRRCFGGEAGICVRPHREDGDRVPTKRTRIQGFRVEGFPESGVLVQNARRTVLRRDVFVDNGEYGAFAFDSKRTRILHNRARGSGEAGFYLGDSRRSKSVIRDSFARENGSFGFFLRDISRGLMTGNRASHNCMGIGLINTGEAGSVHRWDLRRNSAVANNRFCPAGEEGPPISGTGIGLVGARGNLVHRNIVLRNRPVGAAFAPGGIVLVSSKPLGGRHASNNTISNNRAHQNEPADLLWDGKGVGNRFRANKCETSVPGGLC